MEFEPIVKEGRVRRSGSKRQGRTALFVVIGLFVVLAVVYFVFLRPQGPPRVANYRTAAATRQDLAERIQLSGAVTVATERSVSAPERGVVAELYVDEGTTVQEGEPLLFLTMSDLEQTRDDLASALSSRRRDLERTELQFQYDVTAAERQRQNLEESVSRAQEDLADIEQRYELDIATATELEAAQDRVSDAEEALENHLIAREEAAALHEFAVSGIEDDVTALETDLGRIDDRIASGLVRAPISGQVMEIAAVARILGSVVNQYQALVQIADTSTPLVQFQIPEAYVNQVSVGQEVIVSVGGGLYPARVTRIGLVAQQASDGSGAVLPIDVEFIEQPGTIVPGTSAVADIVLGTVEDALVLPRGAYLSTGEQRYVYVVSGNRAGKREVIFGSVQDNLVEVRSGLAEGEVVITSGYQSFIEEDEIILEE